MWRHDATSPIAHTCGALARPRVVADHAVVDLDAAALEPVGGRARPDADDDEIGVEFGAVGEHDLLDVVGPADVGHPDAAAHVDALGAVQPGHQLADLLAEHRRQRLPAAVPPDDIHAELRRLAATSQPMKPAPTTTARRAEPACLRSARLSSNVRSTWMPARSGNDGMRLGTRPVAMISSS